MWLSPAFAGCWKPFSGYSNLWGLDLKPTDQEHLGWPEKWMFIDNRRLEKKIFFVASQTFTTLMRINVSRNGIMMKLHAELIFHK